LNEENREIENTPGKGDIPIPAAGYKLDWQDAEIRLKKGRFIHTLSRPGADLIRARERELESEIPIGRDGGYKLPDPTAQEDVDAKYYDQIVVKTEGYESTVPGYHKAAAFQGLYRREIYVDEETDIFADEVPVLEEIGSGDEPDFTIRHIMRQPTEGELKRYRRRAANTEIKPGKRGKQKLVTTSNLPAAMEYYKLWLVRIEGAHISGQVFTPELRDEFIALVDPLIQRKVVSTFAGEFNDELTD
jgi:hypothetical protein